MAQFYLNSQASNDGLQRYQETSLITYGQLIGNQARGRHRLLEVSDPINGMLVKAMLYDDPSKPELNNAAQAAQTGKPVLIHTWETASGYRKCGNINESNRSLLTVNEVYKKLANDHSEFYALLSEYVTCLNLAGIRNEEAERCKKELENPPQNLIFTTALFIGNIMTFCESGRRHSQMQRTNNINRIKIDANNKAQLEKSKHKLRCLAMKLSKYAKEYNNNVYYLRDLCESIFASYRKLTFVCPNPSITKAANSTQMPDLSLKFPKLCHASYD